MRVLRRLIGALVVMVAALLGVKGLFGTTENAVKTRILIAISVYVLGLLVSGLSLD